MRSLLLIFSVLFICSSCYYGEGERTLYEVNDNFILSADSIVLQSQQPLHNQPVDTLSDTVVMYENDAFVVAQKMIIPEDSVDSVWVKIAHDQMCMGWLRQAEFLEHAVPDDPISQFIYIFSQKHMLYFLLVMMGMLCIVTYRQFGKQDLCVIFLRDIPSFYPSMLVITLGGAAVLYASIQTYVPETWVHYYYHPTLNPFDLPLILGLFVASFWLLVVLITATVDEVFRQLPFGNACLYMLSLSGVCVMVYLIFTFSALYFIGYLLYVVFVTIIVWRYFNYSRAYYLCGKCGAKMHKKGKCPHCNTLND